MNEILSPIRWVGGKRKLADQIISLMPPTIETYYEPFLGGGSIALKAIQQNRAKRYILSDINSDLIRLWQDIQNNTEGFIVEVDRLQSDYNGLEDLAAKRAWYLKLRDKFNDQGHDSAGFLTLTRTAFNALTRYNGQGRFNSSFGSRRTVNIDLATLRLLGGLLRSCDVQFRVEHFDEVGDPVRSGDFVYFDPPYHPLAGRGAHVSYSKEGWSDHDEVRLRQVADLIVDNGGSFLLSNHNTPEILELFQGYGHVEVETYKCFSGKASSRTETKEIILGNGVKTADQRAEIIAPCDDTPEESWPEALKRAQAYLITTAEEFVQLRYHNDLRATYAEAKLTVWQDVIARFPHYIPWVIHNKTVPLTILWKLARSDDENIVEQVARKRKCCPYLFRYLSKRIGSHSIAQALYYNAKARKALADQFFTVEYQGVSVNAVRTPQDARGQYFGAVIGHPGCIGWGSNLEELRLCLEEELQSHYQPDLPHDPSRTPEAIAATEKAYLETLNGDC